MLFRFVIVLMMAGCAYAQRKPGDPMEHLPKNVEVLTYFGERADISPDNRQIAFMNKSFGDAFVVGLDGRKIRCLRAAASRELPFSASCIWFPVTTSSSGLSGSKSCALAGGKTTSCGS